MLVGSKHGKKLPIVKDIIPDLTKLQKIAIYNYFARILPVHRFQRETSLAFKLTGKSSGQSCNKQPVVFLQFPFGRTAYARKNFYGAAKVEKTNESKLGALTSRNKIKKLYLHPVSTHGVFSDCTFAMQGSTIISFSILYILWYLLERI